MTGYKVEKLPFDSMVINQWGQIEAESDNWPVVYTLSHDNEIYVGETVNAATRLTQHLHSPSKKHLERVQIILNETFNKSVCLDLESHLIRYFAADGKHRVLNANAGITYANYFDRDNYRESFNELFDLMVKDGMLTRPVPEIINSNLFKFSPFKALNSEQAIALSGVIERVISDIKADNSSQLVIQGDPGTGKTIVAIYLIKLLRDLSRVSRDDLLEQESVFADFFTEEVALLLKDLEIALVVPQQSLRATLKKVFALTPGLNKSMVMTAFEVGESEKTFDILIVDESHRLGQRANQPSAKQNNQFRDINIKLFGSDLSSITQLDWIVKKSRHQLLLLDTAQSIKPADLPLVKTTELISKARSNDSLFKLSSQMRVMGGTGYLDFVKQLFTDNPIKAGDFNGYDLRFYDDLEKMQQDILSLNEEHGLSRLLAGYAWEWKSKKNPELYDIEIGNLKLRWNQTLKDWINSPTSHLEVGSIHVIQGYDLNYAGVIIGNDIGYNPNSKKLIFRRDQYFDVKGRENNKRLGIKYTDEDLLGLASNIYKVLMTRGIKGTFVYVSDSDLAKSLKSEFAVGDRDPRAGKGWPEIRT
jgi:hypothetical protein